MRKLICIMLFCACFLCGCREDYDRDDVSNYVKNEYNLKNISVSRQPEKVMDDMGYENYLWKVDDHEHRISFHVLDDSINGMFGIGNSLWSDYEDVRLLDAFSGYQGQVLKLKNIKTEEGMYQAKIIGSFSSRSELQTLFRETNAFLENELDNDVKVSVCFQMDNPYRGLVKDEDITEGDFVDSGVEFTEEQYKEAEEEFVCSAINLGFDEYLEEYSQEELAAVVTPYKYRLGISDSQDGPYEYYDDLCTKMYHDAISFSVLYEVLVREGFEVEGDNDHYSFVGIDGSTYEISYEFNDYEYVDDDGNKTGYYYIKDGNKKPMEYYFYYYFDKEWVHEVTGIYFQPQWHEENE